MNFEHRNHDHYGLHLGLKIGQLVLKAASVAAAVCIAKEIHNVHRSIEEKK